ncbi:Ser/Thr protein kinase, partial [Reticulomyxa filosa]
AYVGALSNKKWMSFDKFLDKQIMNQMKLNNNNNNNNGLSWGTLFYYTCDVLHEIVMMERDMTGNMSPNELISRYRLDELANLPTDEWLGKDSPNGNSQYLLARNGGAIDPPIHSFVHKNNVLETIYSENSDKEDDDEEEEEEEEEKEEEEEGGSDKDGPEGSILQHHQVLSFSALQM